MKLAVVVQAKYYCGRLPIIESLLYFLNKEKKLQLLLCVPKIMDIATDERIEQIIFDADAGNFLNKYYKHKWKLKSILKQEKCTHLLIANADSFSGYPIPVVQLADTSKRSQEILFPARCIAPDLKDIPFYFRAGSIADNKHVESPYFLCYINAQTKHFAVEVLKAFSIFKKRMKSGLQLKMFCDGIIPDKLIPDFELYKYREDVLFFDDVNLLQTCYQNAMAVVIPANEETFLYSALDAIQQRAILIVQDNKNARASFQDEITYYNSIESLGRLMQDFYKDEFLQNLQRQKAESLAQQMAAHLFQYNLSDTMSELSSTS